MIPASTAKRGVPHLWRSFIVIVATFVLANIVSIYEIRTSQAEVRLITRHAATNIELVARLSRDLDQKRLLLENHILEKQVGDMDRIEAELDKVDGDIAAASRSYRSIGDEEGEQGVWEQLVADIVAIEPQIARAVSLSRRNLDDEARAQLNMTDARLQAINQASDTLLGLNHARTNQEVAQVRALQRQAVIFLVVLTVAWTVFALLTAKRATQLINERERQMNHAMTQLEERNRELDAFAGRVAHDLRGPLTAISLAAPSLVKRGALEESISAILARGVARMEVMIQDLLTLSRISAQVTGATCKTAAVAALAREDLTPIVESAGGRLIVEATTATVACNEGLLRQVLWNVGENAVKYRRSDVQLLVEIKGRTAADSYEFSISDNGAGMSSLEASHACEPFFRGKEAQSTPGTGLGLSIVKRVVEVSGGTISIDSIAERGTTFRIRLPLVPNETAA
jgi:signal transduction histidine kinase